MSKGKGVISFGELKGSRGPKDFEWKIPDFLSLTGGYDDWYGSPKFFFCDSYWYVRVYPHSQGGWVAMYFMSGDIKGPPVTVTYSMFLKKINGRKRVTVDTRTFRKKDDGFGTNKAIEESELWEQRHEFMPDGVLTVICSLTCVDVQQGAKDVGLQTAVFTGKDVSLQTTQYGAPNTKALCDFEKMFLDKEACDVTLQVRGQKFEAHGIILRARSSVFVSMLSHDMREKNTGVIDIVDCEPEHFPDFLRFLYCGRVEIVTSQNTFSLYRAADKYDVQDLKSECLTFIKSHLDVDNFCDTITLALQYGETNLIKQATDFFTENMLKIIVTVKWQVFLTENPIQSNELTIKAVSAQKSSNS